eukprot:747943-Hanusia_phi.AAC.4
MSEREARRGCVQRQDRSRTGAGQEVDWSWTGGGQDLDRRRTGVEQVWSKGVAGAGRGVGWRPVNEEVDELVLKAAVSKQLVPCTDVAKDTMLVLDLIGGRFLEDAGSGDYTLLLILLFSCPALSPPPFLCSPLLSSRPLLPLVLSSSDPFSSLFSSSPLLSSPCLSLPLLASLLSPPPSLFTWAEANRAAYALPTSLPAWTR